MDLEDALAVAGAAAALAGIFSLTVVAVVSTWRLSQDFSRWQQDLLHSAGRIEGLLSGFVPERAARGPAPESAVQIAPNEFSRQFTSLSERLESVRQTLADLAEGRASEVRDLAQTASEMENTLKRLETAVSLMADGVAAFIQRLEGERGSPET